MHSQGFTGVKWRFTSKIFKKNTNLSQQTTELNNGSGLSYGFVCHFLFEIHKDNEHRKLSATFYNFNVTEKAHEDGIWLGLSISSGNSVFASVMLDWASPKATQIIYTAARSQGFPRNSSLCWRQISDCLIMLSANVDEMVWEVIMWG